MRFLRVRTAFFAGLSVFAASFLGTFFVLVVWQSFRHAFSPTLPALSASTSSANSDLFIYSFNVAGALHETRHEQQSSSPYWHLASGGMFIVGGGKGQTLHGDLSEDDFWRARYRSSSPIDSDDGAHPQNLFRLITKGTWGDAREEFWFRIVHDNFSPSQNRNASNGVFIMSRYQSEDTLYYAGLRVDGTAVIKKKYQGTYYTLAQLPFTRGSYDRLKSPSLLPHNEWIGLRSETLTRENGSVSIDLYMRREHDPEWVHALSANDAGNFNNTQPITEEGAFGIRTDFMDVEFRDFRLEKLSSRE